MDEIFYLVRHGGFSYLDCYNMPIQVRKYNKNKLNSEIKEENEKAQKNNGLSMRDMAVGDVKEFKKPDYISKAPKKK